MSAIIERVARALCESLEADDYGKLSENSIAKEAYRQQARAAIKAADFDEVLAALKGMVQSDYDVFTGKGFDMALLSRAIAAIAKAEGKF